MSAFWTVVRRLVLVVLVLLVAAVAAVRFLLPAERLVRLAVTRVERATGADVELGRVSLRFWPRLHMLVEGGRVSASGAGAARGALVGYAVEWRRLAVALSWRDLLRRRVTVTRLELDGPVVTVVTRPGAHDGAGGSGAAPPALALGAVAVRDGTLHWRTAGGGPRLDAWGWRQDVTFPGDRLLARLVAGGPPWPGRGTERLHWRGRVDSLRWQGAADTAGVKLDAVAVDLTLALPPAGDRWEWRLAALKLPGAAVAGEGTWIPAPRGADRLTGQWRLVHWEPAVLPHLLALAAAPRHPALAAWLRAQDFTGGELTAAGELDLPLPPPRAVAGLPPPGVTATVTADRLPLRPPRHREAWRLAATARLADGRLTVQPCRLEPADGAGGLDLTLHRFPEGNAPRSELAASWSGLPLPALLRWGLARPGEFVSGTTAGELRLAWRGDAPDSLRATLGGEGRCRVADGTLHLERWLHGAERYLGDRSDLLQVVFGSLGGTLRVDAGELVVPDLALDGPDTEWRGSARLGFDGSLDARLQVRLPAGVTPGEGLVAAAASLLRDADGRITLPLHLTGRIAAPAVALELASPGRRLEGRLRGWLDKLRGNK